MQQGQPKLFLELLSEPIIYKYTYIQRQDDNADTSNRGLDIFVNLAGEVAGEVVGEHFDEIVEKDLSDILGLKYEESDDPFILNAVVDALGQKGNKDVT